VLVIVDDLDMDLEKTTSDGQTLEGTFKIRQHVSDNRAIRKEYGKLQATRCENSSWH
jgi:hypothetical protein